MTERQISSDTRQTGAAPASPLALVTAIGFVAFYLLTDVALRVWADSGLPLPDAAASVVRDWYADNAVAAVAMGLTQAGSVLLLTAHAALIRLPRARGAAVTAAGLMLVSSVCTWILAGMGAEASLGTTDLLRTAGFIAGGTLHVLALGVFVFVASREGGFGRPLRILAMVSLIVAVLSISSLFVFQGAAFILLGRLLAMIWVVSAAISLTTRQRRSRR